MIVVLLFVCPRMSAGLSSNYCLSTTTFFFFLLFFLPWVWFPIEDELLLLKMSCDDEYDDPTLLLEGWFSPEDALKNCTPPATCKCYYYG
jgi:hypothetical protein